MIVRNSVPQTAHEKEMARWDIPRNQFVKDAEGNDTDIRGMGAIGIEEFPQMLYRARVLDNGQAAVSDPREHYALDPTVQARAAAFTSSCQLKVHNAQERDRARDNGWCLTPQDALDRHEALQRDIAKAAAEENYRVARMSEKAQAEHKAYDESTDKPVTDVPAPKKAPKATRVAVA